MGRRRANEPWGEGAPASQEGQQPANGHQDEQRRIKAPGRRRASQPSHSQPGTEQQCATTTMNHHCQPQLGITAVNHHGHRHCSLAAPITTGSQHWQPEEEEEKKIVGRGEAEGEGKQDEDDEAEKNVK